jgi:alkylresorcinol/alkylpyrone synthase
MAQILPRLISLGTAVPPHCISQADVLSILAQAKGQALPSRMAEILGNTGISQRHIAMQPEYYFGPRSWASRALVYETVAAQIFEAAAMQALARANLRAADIGQIVFVSTRNIGQYGYLAASYSHAARMLFWPEKLGIARARL